MSQSGFSIIEIAVALVVVSASIIALTNLFITTINLQRQTNRIDLATTIAEDKIESLRNNHYNSLALSPPAIDFTNELPDELPSPRSATVTVSEPSSGIKQLDVSITYEERSGPKTIALSTMLGNIGIGQ